MIETCPALNSILSANVNKFLIEDPYIIVVRFALRNDSESYAGGSVSSW
jgi:hypothetical protein